MNISWNIREIFFFFFFFRQYFFHEIYVLIYGKRIKEKMYQKKEISLLGERYLTREDEWKSEVKERNNEIT